MNFPSISSAVAEHFLPLLAAPICLTLGGVLLRKQIRASRIDARRLPKSQRQVLLKDTLFRMLFSPLLLLVGCGLLTGYLRLFHDLSYRWLDPEQVESVDVTRLEEGLWGVGLNPGKTITLHDKRMILRGLQTLEQHQGYLPNHEDFVDGYRLRLHTPTSTSELRVFKKSKRGEQPLDVAVVELPFTGGTYTCPGFLKWVEEEVDPLFR
jgi:hypothetical protein